MPRAIGPYAGADEESRVIAVEIAVLRHVGCYIRRLPTEVELKPDGQALKCVECKRVYPIRDDIPAMLIEEATIEEDEQSARHR